MKRAIRRLRAIPPSARKPLPSGSSDDGSGVVTAGVETEPPVRTPAVGALGLVRSAKRLPLRSAGPGVIEKEPVQNVPAGPRQISPGVELKTCGPKNIQRKSSPFPNTVSMSNNPPEPLGAKLTDASEVKPANVGEENVTSIELKKSTKPNDEAHGGWKMMSMARGR